MLEVRVEPAVHVCAEITGVVAQLIMVQSVFAVCRRACGAFT